MTFSSFLVEYALLNVFQGNRSAYAHAINMDDGNFRRLFRNIAQDKSPSKLVNQTIDLCIHENIDITIIFQEYQSSVKPSIGRRVVCAYDYFVMRAKRKLEKYREKAIEDERNIAMHDMAQSFLEHMERDTCGKNGDTKPKCKFFHAMGHLDDMDDRSFRTCPCKRFEDLIDSFHHALEG